MEYDRGSRIEKRKALSERNVIDTRSRQSQGNARFSGFPNTKSAFYQAQYGPNHLLAKDNAENQKENFIDLSRVKKEPRVNIHKLEKKKEEEPSTTFESQNDENSTSKRKKVENPENDTWFVADSEPLNDVQDTRMPWDESTGFEFGYLSPSLTELIFKPKPNKICRPPNAFMLFAKEQRRQVGMDHPDETNRQISIILGNMWRALSDEDKMKYYKEAQALEKLHKETYPSYVYSPNEARMRKQSKAERKQKLKETPPGSKSFFVSENSTGSPPSSKDAQEKNAETTGDKENNSPNENSNKDPRLPIQEKHPYPQMHPFYSPMYFPYPCRGWPVLGNRMPGRNMCTPQCNCPHQGLNKGPVTSQLSAAFKGNPRCPPPTYFNNQRPFLPFPNQVYPFPPRPMVPDNFHPALWNPWLLWPGAIYCPPPMTNMEELQKNWQRIRMPHQVVQEKPHPGPSTGKRVEAKSQQCQTEDSDDDAGFRPLVIDDGRNSEGDKENSK
ncbi:hypothetical protein AVEN_134609-1 [Araneus ventricosus]|uniref:Sex-determining region Y protein n=1 Tax=Araneus ventricosus TaxID=182803 RepID=A0A4Y2NEB0_ARAVE|nr:hypothetical protein AVEN_134609-1 [Araneus ventricosus]